MDYPRFRYRAVKEQLDKQVAKTKELEAKLSKEHTNNHQLRLVNDRMTSINKIIEETADNITKASSHKPRRSWI